jgi:hypothetical protein
MKIEEYSFGSIRIDGVTYSKDVIIDHGQVRPRKKKPSKKYRDQFGHTPLSVEEDLPWKCRTLVIGTGASAALPVMDEVKREARRRKVRLTLAPTPEAIRLLSEAAKDTNAVLHLTC